MQKLQYEKTRSITNEFEHFYFELKKQSNINAAILFGSLARGDQNFHSDLDLILWIENEKSHAQIVDLCNDFWESREGLVIDVLRKKSIVVYTKELKKIDLLIIHQLEELDRYYLGSRIPANLIPSSILFDRTNLVNHHLKNLVEINQPKNEVHDSSNLINYFLFAFEVCSKQHAKSDGYQFYFNYNIALNTLIQLQCILSGNTSSLYSPKKVTSSIWKNDALEELYQLRGTLFLPHANQQKQKLLQQFYRILKDLAPHELEKCQSFCEAIYQRDFFWNFRDYNLHAPQLSKGKIYRSATLSLFDGENVDQLLGANNITTIIDLRAPKEVAELPYNVEFDKEKRYVLAPFDPWNQPDWFQKDYHYGTNRAIAYRYFLVACQPSFKLVIDSIINSKGAVLIHCHAGKDRTGLIIGAIQLLLGVKKDSVKKDYMASVSDTDLTVFDLLFEQVQARGGITSFFEYQGISLAQQQMLITKLS